MASGQPNLGLVDDETAELAADVAAAVLTPLRFLERSAAVWAGRPAVVSGTSTFHSGDLGVMHPDGYVELRDRLKDVVISGGENIATIEVEQALAAHPAVAEAAVVAAPDELWGEVPVAFVTAAGAHAPDAEELRAFTRGRLAGFKVPKRIVVVDDLPKTGTGKIQKFVLRERAREWGEGPA